MSKRTANAEPESSGGELASIEERLSAIEERLFDLPTREEIEAIVRAPKSGASRRFDRSTLPSVISVRTRDGRRRHMRAAKTFGPAWTTLATESLSDSQLEAIVRDPVLEVRGE